MPFPFYTVANGLGGWWTLEERVALMSNPDTRSVAMELFVSDAFTPENCVRRAHAKRAECSEFRARLLARNTNLALETVLALFEKLNAEADERTIGRRTCGKCRSDADEGRMLLCDHVENTARCTHALHIGCCDPPLKDIPSGSWFCPKHQARSSSQPPAASDSVSDSDSGPDSDSDSDSDSDADTANRTLPEWTPVAGTLSQCPLCFKTRLLVWSIRCAPTEQQVCVCGPCHDFQLENTRLANILPVASSATGRALRSSRAHR
jgi:hypothetical protein